MLVKILGAIDLISSIVLLMIVFGITPWIQILLFCAGLLFLKGLFILTGEPLSAIDLISSVTLLVSIFFMPWSGVVWILSLLLLAKGSVSLL